MSDDRSPHPLQPMNLFDRLDCDPAGSECFEDLLVNKGVRIERIVSHGHASADNFWYDQSWDEWVLVLKGHAVLEFSDRELVLQPGDYAWIPAGMRHRVQSTATDGPTVWLAIHWDATDA